MSKRILIHGADPTLLETRRLVLARAGFAVETVSDKSNLTGLLQALRPDLLVVCSSLSLDSQQADVRAAHAIRPRLRCVVVSPLPLNASEIGDADVVFHPFEGAASFIVEVQRLLSA